MKHFWHYIEGKRQDSIGIDTLKNQSGNIVTDPSEKAEILNNHFKSVLTIEDTTSIPDKGISPYPSITDIDITVNVRNLLKNLDTNKSPGPDNIYAAFLKHGAFEVLPRNGTVPVSWKQPSITPIYKKGDHLKSNDILTDVQYGFRSK